MLSLRGSVVDWRMFLPPPKKIHIFIPQTCVILGWGRGELLQRGGSFQVWINWGFFFFKDFIYLFLERGREGEREGEKHHCVVASHAPPTGDLACNPGMCPAGNWTGDPLVHRPVLNLLSYTNQGNSDYFLKSLYIYNKFKYTANLILFIQKVVF